MTNLDFLNGDAPSPTPATRGVPWGTVVLVLGMLAVVGVLATQLFRQNTAQPRAGQPAPDFSLTTFEGETLTLAGLRGQWVLVNFWGSWCAPCADEAPELEEIYRDYQARGLIVVGVNWLDTPTAAQAFVDRFGITYPNGEDLQERVAKAYHIEGAPESFLIAPDGVVAYAWLGPVTYPVLADALDEKLAGAGT